MIFSACRCPGACGGCGPTSAGRSRRCGRADLRSRTRSPRAAALTATAGAAATTRAASRWSIVVVAVVPVMVSVVAMMMARTPARPIARALDAAAPIVARHLRVGAQRPGAIGAQLAGTSALTPPRCRGRAPWPRCCRARGLARPRRPAASACRTGRWPGRPSSGPCPARGRSARSWRRRRRWPRQMPPYQASVSSTEKIGSLTPW